MPFVLRDVHEERVAGSGAVLEESVLPEVVRDIEVVVAVVVRVAGCGGEAPTHVAEAGSRRFVHEEGMPVSLHVPEEAVAHAVQAVVGRARDARVSVARDEEVDAAVPVGVEEHGGGERAREAGETPLLGDVAELSVPEILQQAARGDVIREKEVRQPVPVHVGRDAAGSFHLRQEVESGPGRRVAKMAGAVVQEEPRMAARNEDVHGAVPVDVHEENSRAVMRRGDGEIRRLHGIEGLVHRDEAARRSVVEKVRDAALDHGAPADGGRRSQPPAAARERVRALFAKQREIEDGERGHALGRRPRAPSPAGGSRRARSRPKRISSEGR